MRALTFLKTYFTVLVLASAIVVPVLLTGCEQKPPPVCKFHNGQFIYSVLDGRKGQIVEVTQHHMHQKCYYDVRFAGDQENQRRSWDVDVVPYARIDWMEEFELTTEAPQ